MSTFQAVQDRINNEYLNRGTFIEETKTAVKAAIRHYEQRRWTFNETSTAVATSAGQSWVAFPANLRILDALQITVNSQDEDLIRRDRAWILSRNVTRFQAQPTDYATFQNRINLSAIPNAIYQLPIYYIKQLPALSAGGDTNAWITGAMEDVIVYHAAKLVWGVSIRNDKEATKFSSLEQLALSNMSSHLEQFSHGSIVPTSF